MKHIIILFFLSLFSVSCGNKISNSMDKCCDEPQYIGSKTQDIKSKFLIYNHKTDSIFKLSSLKSNDIRCLFLGGTYLFKDPYKYSLIQFDEPNKISNITHLEISQFDLSSLFDSILVSTELNYLSLNVCKLNSLTNNIGRSKKLITLQLRCNHLTNLPDSIISLQNLQNIDLSDNKFTSIPPQLLKLTSLKMILLSNLEGSKNGNQIDYIKEIDVLLQLLKLTNLLDIDIEVENRSYISKLKGLINNDKLYKKLSIRIKNN